MRSPDVCPRRAEAFFFFLIVEMKESHVLSTLYVDIYIEIFLYFHMDI